VGRRVIEREVGEGAADVDAEPVTPHARFSLSTRDQVHGREPA
jgi:hypothetical protein